MKNTLLFLKNELLRMNVLTLFFAFFVYQQILAEGTKQVSPTNSINGAALTVRPDLSVGSYLGCPDDQRIRFTIVDHANENLYMGFQPRNFHNTTTAIVANAYYRISNVSGAVVAGPFLIPSTAVPGFISNYGQAVAGPNIGGANPAGYQPLNFNPAENGDFYIEIYRSNDGGVTRLNGTAANINNGTLTFPFFDFTVADATNTFIDGRVWSKKWALSGTDLVSGNFQQTQTSSFIGDYFAYTPDQYIVQIRFEVGFKPLLFELGMNFEGPVNTGNFFLDRRSKNNTSPMINGYKVFFANPDPIAFPTGTVGNVPVLGAVYGCPGSYFIPFTIDRPGDVTLTIDLDGNPGYQTGTEDVLLQAFSMPSGNNDIPWNGLDGLGNPVPNGSTISAQMVSYQGRTNLPINDAELNSNGFSVVSIFPSTGNKALYWDDTNLTPFGVCNAITQTASLTSGGVAGAILGFGVLGPTHAWDGSNPSMVVPAPTSGEGSATPATVCDDYGNTRCINTWFYAVELSSSSTTMNVPVCAILSTKLLKFDASFEGDNTVGLSWETVENLGNYIFVLEKSENGFDFQEVAKLTSNTNSSYKVQDSDIQMGTSIYRIRLLDFNGNAVESMLESVDIELNEDFSLSSNPLNGTELMIQIPTNKQFDKIEIVDEMGRIVYVQTDKISELNSIECNFENGVYLVTLFNKDQVSSKKLIIQK